MIPTVNRAVHFHRQGRVFAATITRVEPQPLSLEVAMGTKHLALWNADENNHDVYLVVFVHTSAIQSVEFSATPVRFATEPTDGCWSWPPRVA